MKKYSSLLFALLLAVIGMATDVMAQTLPPAGGNFDWQQEVWGITSFWPGRTNNGTDSAIVDGPGSAYTINNSTPANPIRALVIRAGATGVRLFGTGDLIIQQALAVDSPLSIGNGLTVVVNGVVDGSGSITIEPGGTLRLNRTTAPAVIGAIVLGAAGNNNGVVSFGPGYNGGRFPVELFANGNVSNEIRINGDMFLDQPLTIPGPAPAGVLNLVAGTFTVRAGQTLTMNQSGANTFIGSGGRLNAEPNGAVIINQASFNSAAAPGILPGGLMANPFTGTLRLNVAGTINLVSDMTMGGTGAILDFNAANATLTVQAGVTLRLNQTNANSVRLTGSPATPGANLQAELGGTIEMGPGFNAGVIPITRFSTATAGVFPIRGTLRNLGDAQMNVFGTAVNTFGPTSTWDMRGNVTLTGAGSLSLGMNVLNSFTGAGRINTENTLQTLALLTNFNGGVIPGAKFADPFLGALQLQGSATMGGGHRIVGRLNMGDGPLILSTGAAPAGANCVVLVDQNSELRLTRSGGGAIVAATPATMYIQGVNSTSQLTLGVGFNGGNIPAVGTGFLPLTASTPDNEFRGRLNLEGTITWPAGRPARFGPASSIVLGSLGAAFPANLNLTGGANSILELNMTAPNSLRGPGVLQGTGTTSTYRLGPGFNDATIPGRNTADPFTATIVMNGSGPLNLVDSLRIGQNGATGQGALALVTATDILTVRPNGYLRINGTAANDFGAGGVGGGAGFVQGTDTTSRVVFGTGAAANTVRGLQSPFNGSLQLFGGAMNINPSLTINTQGGFVNDANATVAAGQQLTLNNTGANSFRGLGQLTATATSTVFIGPAFNSGGSALAGTAAEVPGTRFNVAAATGYVGTLAFPQGNVNVTGTLSFANAATNLLALPQSNVTTVRPNSVILFQQAGIDPIIGVNATTQAGNGKLQGVDATSIVRFTGANAILDVANLASPFNGRLDLANPQVIAANTVAKGLNGAAPTTTTATFGASSVFNMSGLTTLTVAAGAPDVGALEFNSTNPGSFTGTLNSSLQTNQNVATPLYGLVRLAAGFNGNTLPGRLFGATPGNNFIGRLVTNGGIGGNPLSLNSPLVLDAAQGQLHLNAGVLNIIDGVTLTISGAVSNPVTRGTGLISAAPNGVITMPANSGFGLPNQLNGTAASGNFFISAQGGTTNVFTGIINSANVGPAPTAFQLSNSLTFGDATGTNGALRMTATTAMNPLEIQANIALRFRNRADQSIVLPGGVIAGANQTSVLAFDDGSLAGRLVNGARLAHATVANNFGGQFRLLGVNTPRLPMVQPSGNSIAIVANGQWNSGTVSLGQLPVDVTVQPGGVLRFDGAGTANSGFVGDGFIQGSDNTASVFFGATFRAKGVAAQPNIPGCNFGSAPVAVTALSQPSPLFGAGAPDVSVYTQRGGYNGYIGLNATSQLEPGCELIVGAPGSTFGILDIGVGAAATFTIPTGPSRLVLNNVSPLGIVLPTAMGTIDVQGAAPAAPMPTAANGGINNINGVLQLGPATDGTGAGALGGTVPTSRFAGGNFGGTLISSSGTYSLEAAPAAVNLTANGRLVLGGTAAANTVTIPGGVTVTIQNMAFDAVTGGTTTRVSPISNFLTPGFIAGSGFQTSSAGTLAVNGTLVFNANTNGGAVTGRPGIVPGNAITPVSGTLTTNSDMRQIGGTPAAPMIFTATGILNLNGGAASRYEIATGATLRITNTGGGITGTGGVSATTGTIGGVLTRGRIEFINTGNIPAAQLFAIGFGATGTRANSLIDATIARSFNGDIGIGMGNNGSTQTITGGDFIFQATSGLDMVGNLRFNRAGGTLEFANTGANSFRNGAGASAFGSGLFPTVAFSGASDQTSVVRLAPNFNNNVIPAANFGTINSPFTGIDNQGRNWAPGRLQIAAPGGGLTTINTTVPGTTRLSFFASNTSALELVNGVLLNIASGLEVRANVRTNGATTLGVRSTGTPRSGFQGASQTARLYYGWPANPANANDLTISNDAGIQKPGVGATGDGLPAFNGTFIVDGGGPTTLGGISIGNDEVRLGTTGRLEIVPNDAAPTMNYFTVLAGGTLTMNNTSPSVFATGSNAPGATASYGFDTTRAKIRGINSGSRINMSATHNGGVLLASVFERNFVSDPDPASGQGLGLRATLGLTGGGTMNLQGRMEMALGSPIIFGANSRLNLGVDTLRVANAPFQGAGTTSYIIPAGTGTLEMGATGNQFFPVGTSTTYLPVNVNNGGQPAIFGVRPSGAAIATLPAGLTGTVNASWQVYVNATQPAPPAANSTLSVTMSWPTASQINGFTPTRTVAFNTPPLGSQPEQAAQIPPGLPTYLSAIRTTTIGATPTTFSSNFSVASVSTPVLVSLNPTSGPIGSTVILTVTNRFNITAVNFGTTPATIVSQGGTTVAVTVPAGLPTNTAVPVTVVQGGQTSNSINFTSTGAAPTPITITSVVPNPITAGLGDQIITINGSNFPTSGVTVSLAGNSTIGVGTVLSANPTLLSVRVPGIFTAVPGAISISVAGPQRITASTSVPVVQGPGPSISSISPSSTTANLQPFALTLITRNVTVGSTISVGGTNLPIVRFGVGGAAGDTVVVIVPGSLNTFGGDAAVVARNQDGRTASAVLRVNPAPAPVILDFSPFLIAPGSPETILTLFGANFQPGATVRFSDIEVQVLEVTPQSVRVRIPASLLTQQGLAVIRLTNADGQTAGARFPIGRGVSPLPSYTINPSTTVATMPASAFTVTATGTNLGRVAAASLNENSLTIVAVSPTQVQVIVPASLVRPGTFLFSLTNDDLVTVATSLTILPAGTTLPNVPSISGITVSGTTITINGANFAPGATVTVRNPAGALVPVTVTSVTGTQIVATVQSPLTPGTYPVTVTVPGQNPVTGSLTVVSVAVNDRISMNIYPNPALEVVTVDARFERPSQVTIKVLNSLGQEVLAPVTEQVGAGAFTKQLRVADLPAGAYTIDITDGTNRTVRRIVKN